MLYTIPIDWEYDYYLGNRMYRSSNENLDCGDGMNLDSYRVITITSNFGMAIITLGRSGAVVWHGIMGAPIPWYRQWPLGPLQAT
jgi:hypothetical protein